MHWLDLVLVVVMGISGLLGLRSGLLWQVARVVIFGGAVYCCIHYHTIPAQWLQENFDKMSSTTVWLGAYIVTFLGVCMAGFLVTLVLEGMLKAANLKPLDRLLGLVAGILKAGLVCGGVMTGVMLYGTDSMREPIGDSRLGTPMLEGMKLVLSAVPEAAKKHFDEAFDKLKTQSADKFRKEEKNKEDPKRDKSKEPTWGPLAP